MLAGSLGIIISHTREGRRGDAPALGATLKSVTELLTTAQGPVGSLGPEHGFGLRGVVWEDPVGERPVSTRE